MPLLPAIAPLIPLIAPVVQSGLNFLGDSLAAHRQRKLAQENWNQQNEYNSPAKQLARFKAAGMNPAYGGGISSGNAAPLSQAAQTVAKPSAPNFLETMAQYQSLKNASLEGDRLKAITDGIKTDNAMKLINADILKESKNDRVQQYQANLWNTLYHNSLASIDAANAEEVNMRKYNPRMISYQRSVQELSQSKEMFELNKKIQNLNIEKGGLDLNMMRSGINSSDNPILRILYRMFTGESKFNSLFK